MTDRLERTIPKIKDPFVRSFLAAADNRDAAAAYYVMPTLETLAEKWVEMEERVKECGGEK